MVIVLLCAVIGGISAICIQHLKDAIMRMQNEVLLMVNNAADLKNQFVEGNSALQKVLLTEDDYFNLAYLDTIENSLSQMGQSLLVIETHMHNAKTAQYLQEVKASYDNYKNTLVFAREKIKSGERQQIISDVAYTLSLKNAENAVQKSIEDFEIMIDSYAEEISTENIILAESVHTVTLSVTICAGLLALTAGILISRNISKPVNCLTKQIKHLADGDTNFDTLFIKRKDEIGEMSSAVSIILESIRALTSDTNMLIDAAVQGRLTVRADANRHKGAYRKIVEGMNATMDAMIAPIEES